MYNVSLSFQSDWYPQTIASPWQSPLTCEFGSRVLFSFCILRNGVLGQNFFDQRLDQFHGFIDAQLRSARSVPSGLPRDQEFAGSQPTSSTRFSGPMELASRSTFNGFML